MQQEISRRSLKRLPLYLNYLKTLPCGHRHISATMIAQAMGLNDVQVRKDLACISRSGKPKIGYVTETLIEELEYFLGYHDNNTAVLVGTGRLGKTLLTCRDFQGFGLRILAAFDSDPALSGTETGGVLIRKMDELSVFCEKQVPTIGIITVPPGDAQTVCDQMVASGIRALWNFAPVFLRVPENVLVQNENIALSLAVLCKHLKERN